MEGVLHNAFRTCCWCALWVRFMGRWQPVSLRELVKLFWKWLQAPCGG